MMRFADVQGNDNVKQALVSMVDSGRVPHAMLFHEEDGGGAVNVVMAFLQYLFCRNHEGASDSCGSCPECSKVSKLIHPDIHFVFPLGAGSSSEAAVPQWRELVLDNPFFTERDYAEAMDMVGKTFIISVSQAREVLSTLSFNSLQGYYKAVVFYLPEKMNADAANRLLKTLEEPSPKTLILLICHNPEKVLPTIASRCQRIRIKPEGKALHGVVADAVVKDLFNELMEGLLARDLLAALETGEALAALPSRMKAREFCVYASACLGDVFHIQQGLPQLVRDQADDSPARTLASRCRKTFPRGAAAVLDRAVLLIDRNINLKILFADMVDRMYSLI